MKKLLRVDTSTRKEGSHSKDLANRFEEMYKKNNHECEIFYRDLSQMTIPHVTQAFIDAIYTPPEKYNDNIKKILQLSNELISELKNVDTIILSTPMYNFGIPSVLKAYIDTIARVGETFLITKEGFTGLITDKKLIIITASGAESSKLKAMNMDFVEPYLKGIFGLFGFTDIEYYTVDSTNVLSDSDLEAKKSAIVAQQDKETVNLVQSTTNLT